MAGAKITSVFSGVARNIQAIFNKTATINMGGAFAAQLESDRIALENYLALLNQGIPSEQAFAMTMTEASTTAQDYANTINTVGMSIEQCQAKVDAFVISQNSARVATLAQNKSLGSVRAILNEYNSGMATSKLNQQQFTASVGQSNSILGNYLSTVSVGGATMRGYIGTLIAAKAASIALRIATTALNAVIGMGLGLVIQLVTSGIQWVIEQIAYACKSSEEKLEDLNEDFEELSSNIQEASKNFRELKSSTEEVADRYAKLAQGVDKLGKNISLSTDEYEEYIKLNNEIAELFPEINVGMDANGNAILALSGDYDTLTQSLKDLLEVSRKEANAEIAKNLPELVKNVNSQIKEYNNLEKPFKNRQKYASNGEYEDFINEFKAVRQEIIDVYGSYEDFLEWDENEQFRIGEIIQRDDKYSQIISRLYDLAPGGSDAWQAMIQDQEKQLGDYNWYAMFFDERTDAMIDALSNSYDYAERELSKLETQKNQKFQSLLSSFTAWAETDSSFAALDTDMQDIATKLISGMDLSKMLDEDGEVQESYVKDYIREHILTPISNASPEVQEELQSLFAIKPSDYTLEEYISTVQEKIKNISENSDLSYDDLFQQTGFESLISEYENTVDKIQEIIPDATDEMLYSLSPDKLAAAFDYVKDAGIESWDELKNYIESKSIADSVEIVDFKTLKDDLDDVKDVFDDVSDIIKDYNDNGYYTLDNLKSLLELEPQYLNALIDENGQINLNSQAYKDYIATKAKSLVLNQIKSLYNDILEMGIEEAQAYANATAYQAETDSLQDLITATTQYYILQAKAKDTANNTTAYTDAIKQSFGTVANYAALYDSWLNSLSTSTNEFTSKTNSAKEALESQKDALEAEKDALEDYKDGLEDAKDALEDYKDELEDAQSSLQSLIDLTMDYIKQMKNDEKDALNDQIDALNDQKDALDDQKDTYADLIDKRKEALKLAKEEREEADELADKQKAVAKDALALAVAKLDNSSAGKKSQKVAADNLASSTKDLKDYLDERSYNKQVTALDEEQEKFEETIERRKELIDEQVAKIESAIDEIEKYLDNERKIYEDACTLIDNDNGTLYSNLWDYTYKYTTQTKAEFDNLWSNAQAAIQRYKGDNDTLIGTMETLQQKIYDTDGEIADLNVQIDEAETQIGYLDDAISATSDAISATSDSIDSVSSSLSGLGGTIADYMSQLSDLVAAANNLDLNTGGGDKTAFWVYHNGKKYETGYNYNGDTEGNRLLAAAELTKLIARDVSGFDNYGLGIVQGYLGVGNSKAKQWYYTFHGKTYTWTTQNQDTAIAQIASQVKKDYGGRMPAGAAVNKWTVQHYATGTYGSTGGLSVTQERGLEAIFGKLANGQYTLMNEGSHVFNADATNNLHKFMDDPQKFMSDYSQYIGTRMGDINDRVRNVTNKVVKYGGDVTIQSAPIYIQGNVDDTTLSKLDRQEKQRYEMFKKKFMAEMLKEL